MQLAALLLAATAVAGCRIGFEPTSLADDVAAFDDARAPACAIQLALAHDTACARVDDQVVCWGRTGEGQLGDGMTASGPLPRPLATSYTALGLAFGGRFSCGIDTSGMVACSGWARDGQLGAGGAVDRVTPGAVSLPTRATKLATGARHSCALLDDGTTWCWGCVQYDPAATSSLNRCTASQATPQSAGTVGEPVSANHQVCFLANGVASCAGDNTFGQLGDGTTTRALTPVPAQLDRIVQYGAGREHACALRDDRTVWCWGSGAGGQLGDGLLVDRHLPGQVPDLADVVELAVGGYHTCARLASGEVRCWGDNGKHQLGRPEVMAFGSPTTLAVPPSISIAASSLTTCSADFDGGVWCSGNNPYGVAGVDESIAKVMTPTPAAFRCP